MNAFNISVYGSKPYTYQKLDIVILFVFSVLTGIFMYDLALPEGGTSRYPSCSKFIEDILPQLTLLIQEPSASAASDADSDTVKYGPSVSFAPEDASLSQSESKMFSDSVIPSMRDITRATLSASDNIVKVLGNVRSENSQVPIMNPLINHVTGLDTPSFLVGRDSKDLSRLGKIKLKDCDLSSDVVYDSVNVMPSDTANYEKNNFHENHVKNPVNGYIGASEERKTAVRLMNTVCRWLVGHVGRCYNGVTPDIYR